jgi:hypothetical protein
VCSTTDQWLKRRYDRKSFQVEFKLVRGHDEVIKKMILGLAYIYHRPNKVDTVEHIQILSKVADYITCGQSWSKTRKKNKEGSDRYNTPYPDRQQ